MTTVADLRIDVGVDDRGSDAKLRRTEQAVERVERGADGAARASDKAGRKIKGMGDKAQRSSRQMGRLADASKKAKAGFVAVGVAAAAFGAKSIASFAAFEAGFSKTETLLDASSFAAGRFDENVDKLRTGIIGLRAASGETFEGLNQGLFDLVSAGVDASEAIGVLETQTVLAKAGLTNVSVAVDGTTTALNAYGEEVGRAEIIASKFFTAQKFGKTTVEELAKGLGQVAPLAAQLGVSFDELLASQSAATATGIRQREAYTGLKAALTNIIKPSAEATKEAVRLGVEFNATSLKAKGLTKFLEDITGSAEFTDQSFQKLFGSAEALNFALAITGGGADVYAKTLSELSNELKSVQTLQTAYEKVLDDTSVKGKILAGTVDAITVAVGAGLAPAFGDATEALTKFLQGDDFEQRLKGIEQTTQNITDLFGGLAFLVGSVADAISEFVGQFAVLGDLANGVSSAFDGLFSRVGKGYGNIIELGRLVREEQERIAKSQEILENPPEWAQASIDSIQQFGQPDWAKASINSIKNFSNAFAELSDVAEGANDNLDNTPGSVDGISATIKALQEQLTAAERLNEAASVGGQASLDLVQEALDIETLTADLFAKAQEAGESVTKAQIQTLVEQIAESEKATDKLLEAEKKLQDRLSKTRSGIADGLEGTLDSFVRDVGRVDFADPRNTGALAQFEERFATILSDFDIESIGLDPEDLADLETKLSDAGVTFGEKVNADIKDAADYFTQGLQFTLGDALDDIIFNAGRGLGDILDRSIRGAVNDNLIDPISKALTGDGNIFGNIKGAFQKQLDGFKNAFGNVLGSVASSAFAGFQGFEIGKGLSEALGITGNKKSQQAGGIIGGALGAGGGIALGLTTGLVSSGGATLGATLGSVVPVIGTLIGAALGTLLGGVFSKPSDNTAQAVFRPDDGFIAGRGQDGSASDPNAQARDAILDSILEVTTPIAGLLGSFSANPSNTAPNDSFLNLAVRSDRKTREQFIELGYQGPNGEPFNAQRFSADEDGALAAVEEGIRLSILAFRGGDKTLREFAQSAVRANRPIEEIIKVLEVLDSAVSSGRDELAQYATAAAKAGRSGEEIIAGLNAFDAALSRTVEPLSSVEQELIDASNAFKPVIADLRSLGQSTSDISRLEKLAFRSVGENYLENLRDVSLQATNSVVASYADLLKQIANQNKDATKLFEAGAITSSELAFAQSVGGQQISGFLSGLSDTDRESLGDFLGVLRETTGDIAVARVELEEQFSYLIDNVEETVSGFEEAARTFQRIAEGLASTADRIRAEFGEGNPRQQAQDLTGELTRIRDEALGGSEQALNAIGAVATSLVQSARQAFGGTTAFSDIRDFALSVLDETSAFAQGLADENSLAAEAAKSDVDLLRDIRGLLSDDRQIGTLQNILDEGKLTNKLIEMQLGAFVSLFNQDGAAANPISDQELQSALDRYLASLPANDNSGSAIVDAAGQQVSRQQESQTAQSSQSNGQQAAAATSRQTDLSVVQENSKNFAELATAIDRNTSAVQQVYFTNEDLTDEIRRDRVARNN